jgi:hypothetical protein
MVSVVNFGRLCFLAVIIGWISIASAAEPIPTAPDPYPVQAVNPSVNPVTQAAVKAGALSCVSRINQVTNFLTAGSQGTGATLYVPAVDPDRKMISVSLEIQNANLPSAYASASFAPNQANGCGAIYEAVAYWNMKCDDVAAKQFAGLKKGGAMRKEIIVLDGGPELRVFLMPAGSGCISIKKEAVQ